MGASLSLLSIVGERDVFDHEHHLFLNIPSYVLSKFLLLGSVSTVQTGLFVFLLLFLRKTLDADVFHNMPCVILTLCLVGWAAVASGLVLSALANVSRETANFLLPLFMMAQIVFSVPISTGKSDSSVDFAYRQLHGHSCVIYPQCQRRATRWQWDDHIWMCDRCYGQYKKRQRAAGQNKQQTADTTTDYRQRKKVSTEQLLNWVRNERAKKLTPHEDRRENKNRPNRVASIVSYVTLSRYGDIALRSFAYHTPPGDPDEQLQNQHWRYESLRVLTVFLFGLLAATGLILYWQAGERRFVLRSHLLQRSEGWRFAVLSHLFPSRTIVQDDNRSSGQ